MDFEIRENRSKRSGKRSRNGWHTLPGGRKREKATTRGSPQSWAAAPPRSAARYVATGARCPGHFAKMSRALNLNALMVYGPNALAECTVGRRADIRLR